MNIINYYFVSACLGAFALGNCLGWTSQVKGKIINGQLGFPITETEDGWINGLMPLGALISVIPIGWLVDAIGRKYSMLILVPVFTLGWAIIAWANSVRYMKLLFSFFLT